MITYYEWLMFYIIIPAIRFSKFDQKCARFLIGLQAILRFLKWWIFDNFYLGSQTLDLGGHLGSYGCSLWEHLQAKKSRLSCIASGRVYRTECERIKLVYPGDRPRAIVRAQGILELGILVTWNFSKTPLVLKRLTWAVIMIVTRVHSGTAYRLKYKGSDRSE